jgi:hypothetical protein
MLLIYCMWFLLRCPPLSQIWPLTRGFRLVDSRSKADVKGARRTTTSKDFPRVQSLFENVSQRSVFRADISHAHAASPVKPANHESRRVDTRRLVGPRLHGSRYTQCSPLFLPASKTLFPRKPWPEPRVPISFLGFAWKPLVVEQLWCAMVTFRGLLFQSGTITTSQRIQFREAKIQKQHILNGTHTYRRHLSHHNFRVLKTREVHNGLQTETESEIR